MTPLALHGLDCLHSDTIALIQQLEEDKVRLECTITQLSGTIRHFREAEARVPRWISVEERLPEDGEDVLVHIKYDDDISDTKVAHRVMKKWYRRVAHRVGGVVTHWMPLPVPPDK